MSRLLVSHCVLSRGTTRIKVESVKRQQLAIGIKTTGQIETLPSKKVEVTTPISGAKVVELLVEPGASVKAELDNSGSQLKPGMFAELEVLTDRTATAILAILSSAVVEANGRKLVYVQR